MENTKSYEFDFDSRVENFSLSFYEKLFLSSLLKNIFFLFYERVEFEEFL